MTNSFNKSGQPEAEERTEAAKAEDTVATDKHAKTDEISQPSLNQSPADKQEPAPKRPNHPSDTNIDIKDKKDKGDKGNMDGGNMDKGNIDKGNMDRGNIKAKKDKKEKNNQKKPAAKEAEIARLKEQLGQLTDTNLRLQAEIQNITRRASLELEKAHKFGLESFAKELIETVDNLEKSLSAITNKDDPIYQGIDLTYQSLIATLAKFSVNQIDPQGKIFDPNFHEAIGRVQSPQYETNRVVAVVEKGYMLYDRLLRPAKVQIAE